MSSSVTSIMAASGEEEVAEGGAGEAVAAEKLSKETALFMIFCCAVVAALVFAWYQRKLRSRRKQTSLGIKYNLALPPERALYEEKADAEPEDPKLRAEWHKEVCSILLRRAIMDIGLHFQVAKDYQHHHALYQRGITIDVRATLNLVLWRIYSWCLLKGSLRVGLAGCTEGA